MPPDNVERELTAVGKLLEDKRDVLRISTREAARRAQISEARWRQVVTGRLSRKGESIPVNPSDQIIVSMALAVEIDPTEALTEAGFKATPESVAAMVREARRPKNKAADQPPATAEEIAKEIGRVSELDLSADAKWRLIKPLYDLLEQAAAEQRRGTG